MKKIIGFFVLIGLASCSLMETEIKKVETFDNSPESGKSQSTASLLGVGEMEAQHIVEADFAIRNEGGEVDENGYVQLENLSKNAVSWHWDFGNGITSTAKTPVHTYPIHGFYPITLTVTDKWGNKHSLTREVLVLCIFGGGSHNE